MPLFSVLIPTAGRTGLTLLALNSILEQEGIDRGDFEIIVADSAATSDLESEINSRKDHLIRYVHVPGNDPSIGWDYAYKQSCGQYILWFDDDDYALPGMLALYKYIIEKSHPDVITTQHIYFYDDRHPRQDRKNSIGVIFFDGSESNLNPAEIIRRLHDYTIGGPALPYRLRSGSTMFARTVCEAAAAKAGFVVVPHLRTSHSLQFLLFPFVKTCIGVSVPTVVVGRLGASLTQDFKRIQKQTKKKRYTFKYSPLSGDLVKNHIAESVLAAHAALPQEYSDTTFDMPAFIAYRYTHELFYSTIDTKTTWKLWRELYAVVRRLQEPGRTKAMTELNRLVWRVPFIQPLKALGLWNAAKDTYQRLRQLIGKDSRRTYLKTSEYIIPLESYGIHDIRTLASRARDIIFERTGQDISLLHDKIL